MSALSGPSRRPPWTAPVALAALVLAAAACGGEPDRPRRPRGPAVWVDPGRAPLTTEGLRTLAAAGVEEAFLEAAALTWAGGVGRLDGLDAAFRGAVPAGTPVTLVVRGSGPPPDLDGDAVRRGVAGTLRELAYRADRTGLLPVGVHLDLGPDLDLEAAPRLLRTLRRSLGGELLLSVTVPPERLGESEMRGLAGAADFVVAFLYGQPPGAPDDPAAWDPRSVTAGLAALEALGVDYVVGLHVLGRADHLGPAGGLLSTTTRAALEELAGDPNLRLSIDDPFAGVGRLVHTFQAQGASRAAGWRVAPGERVRVVRTAPAVLRDLLDSVDEAGSDRHAGYLFHRAAGPEEDLSLAPAELAAALGAVSPVPDLLWNLVVQSRRSDSATFQLELLNRSRQRTDLAATDGNYLEVRVEGGYFERVDPGAFSRYSLWHGEQEARPGTGWREPDGVRLYTRLVGAGERIGGAVLTVTARGGEPAVFVSGRFFLADGSELDLPPAGGPLGPSMSGPSAGSPVE